MYEWQPTTLHAKTFVVDGEWFTVGSMNFDNRSMALNDEATLMVLDRTGGQEMNRIFLDDLRARRGDHDGTSSEGVHGFSGLPSGARTRSRDCCDAA